MSQISQLSAKWIAACSLIMATGCGSDTDAPENGESQSEAVAAADLRCDDRFIAAYNQLQPNRLGISASKSSAIARMNEWLVECAAEELTDPNFPEQLSAEATAEFSNRLSARRFGQRDIEYVRDCILARSIGTQILDSAADDRKRVVDAFYYVIEHVELLAKPRAVLSPFEILLFGKGTAEDRVWVFFEVLHQMHFDTFVVRSRVNSEAWLVGVLVDEQVLLFDPRLGIAVPVTGDAAPVPQQPATLSQVQADAGILAQLSTTQFKHPLDGADLKSPKIDLIANSTRWSPRLKVMQSKLSGDRAVFVYEPLADETDFQGTLTRVSKAGGKRWTADGVGLWMYAEQQSEQISRSVESDIRVLDHEMQRFTAPVSFTPIAKDGGFTYQFESASNGLLKMRIRQLSGEYNSKTTADLMRIRDNELPEMLFPPTRGDQQPKPVPLPDFLRNSNNRAARDALYFIGECQRSRGEFDASISTFRNYVRKYPDGERVASSTFLTALGLMRANQLDVAIRTLNKIDGDMQPTAAWFTHRWQGSSANSGDVKTQQSTSPSTDDPTSGTSDEKTTAEPHDAENKVEPAPAEPKASADKPIAK